MLFPKINQTSAPNRSKIDPKSAPEPTSLPSRFCTDFDFMLDPTWGHLGDQNRDMLGPCWLKNRFLRFKKALKNDHDFQQLWRAFWGRFWTDFGDQNQPKIDTEAVSRANMAQKHASLISPTKNKWFLQTVDSQEVQNQWKINKKDSFPNEDAKAALKKVPKSFQHGSKIVPSWG